MQSGDGQMKLSGSAMALLFAFAWLAPATAFAQSQTPEPAKVAKPAPTPAASPTPAPQPKIRRTESIVIDNWTVNCAETDQPNANLQCSAILKIAETVNNSERVVFTWLVGNRDGKLAAVLSMPPGVMITPGVQLKIGEKDERKLRYTACLPDHCEAVVPMDDATVKVLSSASTAEASVVAVNGNTVNFKINLKGFEKALAEVKK
jgi:invasion protein IalB